MASSTARGYGYAHQQERKRWKPVVEAGQAVCARCNEPIAPDAKWDLDHTDDRQAYRGPSHRACNRRTVSHLKEQVEAAQSAYSWFD
jgi:hypothetical protein